MAEIIAVPINELEPEKFFFSEKKTKTWNFKDQQGKQQSGSQTYVELYYEKPGQKLCFLLENVRTYNGIQTTSNVKRGFMSVNLKDDHVKLLRQYVEQPVFQLSYANREVLLPGGKKIKHPAEMKIIFEGIIKEGKEKKDNPDEKWDDQLTCNVPMRKKGQQPVVDDNLCTVEDLDGRDYAWTAIESKTLKEVAVEVEKVVFKKGAIRIHGTYRMIVPEDQAKPKVTSKRRLQQRKRASTQTLQKTDNSDNVLSAKVENPVSTKISGMTPPEAKKTRPLPGQ